MGFGQGKVQRASAGLELGPAERMDLRFFETVMYRPAGAWVFNIAYYGISQEWQLKKKTLFRFSGWGTAVHHYAR